MTWRPTLSGLHGSDVLLLFALFVISTIALVWWLIRVFKALRTGGIRSAILRPSSLVVLLLSFAWLYVFVERTSGILPEGDLTYEEDYLCWPYNVSVYSIEGLQVGPTLQHYPLDSYLPGGKELERTRWTRYNEVDTAEWHGMDSTLKDCVGNTDLYHSLVSGNPIYFAGTYSRMVVETGVRRRQYETLLFLDTTHQRLHMFKDINKVF